MDLGNLVGKSLVNDSYECCSYVCSSSQLLTKNAHISAECYRELLATFKYCDLKVDSQDKMKEQKKLMLAKLQ